MAKKRNLARNRKRTGRFASTGSRPSPSNEVEKWRSRISRAREIRADHRRKYDVERAEKFFLGDQDAAIAYNHLAATIKTSRPNLFYQMPKFYIEPKPRKTEPITKRTAAIAEGVLEAIARHDDNLESAGNLATLQAYFILGSLKTCYEPRMEPNPSAGQPVYETIAGEVRRDELGEPVTVKDALTGAPVVEPKTVLTDEVYSWRWVDAAAMLLPDEGPDRARWSWIGEEVIVLLDDAKNDPRFPKDKRDALKSNIKSRTGEARKQPSSDLDELFKYVECYDRRNKRWYVVADGQDFDDFLLDRPFPSWIDDDPYALLILGDPVLGPEPSPWPKPVVADWLGPQEEYNTRRQQINEGCKRAARKGVYREGAFDDVDAAVQIMQSPTDMEWAKGDPDKLKIIEVPALSNDIWRDLVALQADWRVITGQTGARMSDPEGGTATEASFVERAANLRDADMQKAVTRWLSEAGRKMLQCVKQTLTLQMWASLREMGDQEFEEYATRVFGIDPALLKQPGLKEMFHDKYGKQRWIGVTREQLQFEADVTVVPGSTRPRNLDSERRAFIEILKIFGSAPQLLLSREMTKRVLRMFEMEDDRLVDELHSLGQQMIQVNATQAGRGQGASSTPTGGMTAESSILAAVNGGSR